jgi:hypothetical protein
VVLAGVTGGGEIPLQIHDAMWRAQEAHILAFAAYGGALRNGSLPELAARMEVPIVPLEQLEAEVLRHGDPTTPHGPKQKVFLDSAKPGTWYEMAWSGLVLDAGGRCYVNADRSLKLVGERWQDYRSAPVTDSGKRHILVKKVGDSEVEVIDFLGSHSGGGCVMVPRDGPREHISGNPVFAFRVKNLYLGIRADTRYVAHDGITVQAPHSHRVCISELLPLDQVAQVEQVTNIGPLVVVDNRLVLTPFFAYRFNGLYPKIGITRRETGFEITEIERDVRPARADSSRLAWETAMLEERPVVRFTSEHRDVDLSDDEGVRYSEAFFGPEIDR